MLLVFLGISQRRTHGSRSCLASAFNGRKAALPIHNFNLLVGLQPPGMLSIRRPSIPSALVDSWYLVSKWFIPGGGEADQKKKPHAPCVEPRRRVMSGTRSHAIHRQFATAYARQRKSFLQLTLRSHAATSMCVRHQTSDDSAGLPFAALPFPV